MGIVFYIFPLVYLFFSLSLGDSPILTEILSQKDVKLKTTNIHFSMQSLLMNLSSKFILSSHLVFDLIGPVQSYTEI